MTRSRRALVVSCGLLLLFGLGLAGALDDSVTFDEPVYLASGWSYLATGDFRMNPTHPPLSKLIAALPLLWVKPHVDWADASWREPHQWRFGNHFLFDWNDADRVLLPARMAILGLAAVLALAVFAWTRSLAGDAAAALALFLCVTCPEVLAHGRLVTTDLSAALFFFLAVAAFEKASRAASWPSLIGCGAALGAACASRYTGLLLGPVLLMLAAACVAWRWPTRVRLWPRAERDAASRAEAIGSLAAGLAIVGLVAWMVLWCLYGGRYAASVEPAAAFDWKRVQPSSQIVAATLDTLRGMRLLPEAYLYGFFDTLGRIDERRGYLMGSYSLTGFRRFFPIAFAIKTPLVLLAALVGALAFAWRALGARKIAFLVVPALMYGAASVNSRVNLGLRYVLPVYPFLFVLGGVGLAELLRRTGRFGRPLLVFAIGSQLVTLGRAYPDYLSYFNEFVPAADAHRYLVDSSLDWGQGLRRLARAQQARGGEALKLAYFGTGRPEYYGVRATLLPSTMRPFPEAFQLFVRKGDLVAVSATNLELLYLPRALRPLMSALKRQQPLELIGAEMFLYRAQFDWSLGPELAAELGWIGQSIASAREKARLEPAVAAHRSELGLALVLAGRPDDARSAFQEALQIDANVLEARPAQRRAYEALR